MDRFSFIRSIGLDIKVECKNLDDEYHVDNGGNLALERSVADQHQASRLDEALEERSVSHFV